MYEVRVTREGATGKDRGLADGQTLTFRWNFAAGLARKGELEA